MEYKILFLFIIFGPYFQPTFKVVAAQIETEIAEFELKKQQQADIFHIEQAAYQLKSTEGNLNEVPQLIQEIDLQQRVTLYKWNSQNSTAAAAAVLKRNGIEKGKPLIVFGSTDEFGGGPPTTSTRTYIVLRKAAQNPEILGNIYYYCNLVYIWTTNGSLRNGPFIEWATFNEADYLKHNKQSQSTTASSTCCTKSQCGIPEWIFGTCQCNSRIQTIGNNEIMNPKVLLKQIIMNSSVFHTERNFDGTLKHVHNSKFKRETETDFSSVLSSMGRMFVRSPTTTTSANTANATAKDTKNQAALTKNNSTNVPSTPTSFDLLLIQQNSNQNGTSELSFKNQVLETRRQTSSSATASDEESLTCINCKTIGNFYEDFNGDELVSKQISAFLKAKFKYRPIDGPLTIIKKQSPFVGYGDCNERQLYMLMKGVQLPISYELDDVIQFYVEILRIHCKKELIDDIRAWLSSKLRFINIRRDFALGVNPTSSIMVNKILTEHEYETLFSALVFERFTVNFVEEITLGIFKSKKKRPKSPLGRSMDSSSSQSQRPKTLGRSMADSSSSPQDQTQRIIPEEITQRLSFTKRLVLQLLDYFQQHLIHHFIKLTRSLLILIRDKFYALLIERFTILEQKQQIHNTSPPTGPQQVQQVQMKLKMNLNELQLLMGLKQFIIYGMSPSLKSGINVAGSYNSFYLVNEERIKLLVNFYLDE